MANEPATPPRTADSPGIAHGGRLTPPGGKRVIVVRTRQLESARDFLTSVGLTFVQEQHGDGPVHWVHETDDVVFEIYPAAAPVVPPPSPTLVE